MLALVLAPGCCNRNVRPSPPKLSHIGVEARGHVIVALGEHLDVLPLASEDARWCFALSKPQLEQMSPAMLMPIQSCISCSIRGSIQFVFASFLPIILDYCDVSRPDWWCITLCTRHVTHHQLPACTIVRTTRSIHRIRQCNSEALRWRGGRVQLKHQWLSDLFGNQSQPIFEVPLVPFIDIYQPNPYKLLACDLRAFFDRHFGIDVYLLDIRILRLARLSGEIWRERFATDVIPHTLPRITLMQFLEAFIGVPMLTWW